MAGQWPEKRNQSPPTKTPSTPRSVTLASTCYCLISQIYISNSMFQVILGCFYILLWWESIAECWYRPNRLEEKGREGGGGRGGGARRWHTNVLLARLWCGGVILALIIFLDHFLHNTVKLNDLSLPINKICGYKYNNYVIITRNVELLRMSTICAS